MSTHTPTPWEFEDIGEEGDNLRINQWERIEANKVTIAIIPVGYSEPFESEQHANAAFIVKACNAHEELVEALKLAYEAMNHMGDVMNNIDIVDDSDIAKTKPAFDAVRAILSKVSS